MSEINTEIQTEQVKPKPKYYTEKHRDYMRKYRAKLDTTYTDAQKKSIKKYSDRIKQEAKLYRELQVKGLVPVSVQ